MKVRIVSSRYLFKEDTVLEKYGHALNKVAPVCYYCDIESGNVNIDMEISSLDALGELCLEIKNDLVLSRPIREGRPFELWIRDDYME